MLGDSRHSECILCDFRCDEWCLNRDLKSMSDTERHYLTAEEREFDSVTWQSLVFFSFFEISPLLVNPPTYKLPPYISPLIQSSNPSSMHSPHPPPLTATSAHLVTANPLASLIPQPAHTHAHFRSVPDTHPQSQIHGPTNTQQTVTFLNRAPMRSALNLTASHMNGMKIHQRSNLNCIPQF